MHVDGKRRGRGRRRQPPLAPGGRFETKARSAVGLRNKKLQVSCSGELRKIFGEEGIPLVVACGPAADAFEQIVGQQLFGVHGAAAQ
jgi:hypothetical protein